MKTFLYLTIAAAGLAAALCLGQPSAAAAPAFGWAQLPPELLGLGLGGLIVNGKNLQTLFIGFKSSFQDGLGMAPPDWEKIASRVPSTTREEEYGWIGKIPNMREWIGPRVVQNISQHSYRIKNRPFELTIAVDRDDIEDDNLGIYAPLFKEMGQSTGAHPNQLVYGLLKDGFTATCYDGQPFFDTDHPVLDENGNEVSVANTDGGSGAPWFLMVTSRALKPLIYQVRKDHNFVPMNQETDDHVFFNKEFVYGVDGRSNVGFGFWQFAWGSKQTLNKDNYKIAREAIMSMKGDHGRPLGLMPDLLVVPPTLEGNALEILNAERDAAGATNVYKGTAKMLVTPWLA